MNYLKVPVEESFETSGGTARWKNPSERGEKPASPKAFYLSLNGAPQEVAFLAQALLRAPGGKLPLLPEGEAAIEKGPELALESGGEKKTVREYLVSGLDFTPTPVWMETDSTFFALASGWQTVIRKGWEGSVAALLKAQDANAAVRTTAREKTLAHRPSGPLAFVHGDFFDAESATLRHDWNVVVEGDRIRAAGPAAQTPAPAGAEIVDAKGKTLLPGLWDMHVHLTGDTDGVLDLAAGVTSVRDLANDTDRLHRVEAQFDTGQRSGRGS